MLAGHWCGVAGDLGQKAEQPPAGGGPHSYDLVRGGGGAADPEHRLSSAAPHWWGDRDHLLSSVSFDSASANPLFTTAYNEEQIKKAIAIVKISLLQAKAADFVPVNRSQCAQTQLTTSSQARSQCALTTSCQDRSNCRNSLPATVAAIICPANHYVKVALAVHNVLTGYVAPINVLGKYLRAALTRLPNSVAP